MTAQYFPKNYNEKAQSPDEKGFSNTAFLRTRSNKALILVNGLMAIVYLVFIVMFLPTANRVLFYFLIAGEVFHLWQILTFLYTVWQPKVLVYADENYLPPVDVYITVTGEPIDIIEETVIAALDINYPRHKVYLLNDGFVAQKDNWQEAEILAKNLGVTCITRTIAGGAKAGNINHALKLTKAPFVAVFDADQVPHKDFLQKIMPLFTDRNMAFVQSPQYYKNMGQNEVTGGAWEQQELFFGPVCNGKNRLNSTFMCGTNMVVRKKALMEVGGMCEDNIAEDFLTSLFIHKKGWKSLYLPEVLAEGLAPSDFLSYHKQQLRWAQGSLQVLFKHNPIFDKDLTFGQKIQYLASASFYVSGLIVIMDAILPLIFFFTGAVPVVVSTMILAGIFLPYIFLTIATLQLTSNSSLTFRAIAFSMGSFMIHIKALIAVITNKKSKFEITSKKALNGNFLYLVIPHIIYLLLTLLGIVVALNRDGLTPAFLSNLAWALFNCTVFLLFITPAVPVKAESFDFSPVFGKAAASEIRPIK